MRATLALILALGASACSWPAKGEIWDDVHATALSLGVPGGSCSGTAVGHFTVLTAAHCFHDDSGKAVKPESISADGRLCHVYELLDDGNDHALLTTDCEFKSWAAVRPADPIVGEQVFIWGNPSFMDDQLRVGRVSGYGSLPNADENSGALAMRFTLYDLASTYGDSGSGIFNMRGELVGVLSIGTDPLTSPFHLMGALPFAFSNADWARATL